jgi:hypothetical protein
MQVAQTLRSEAYSQVRRNDEGEAQRRRWIFYEAIPFESLILRPQAEMRLLDLPSSGFHPLWHVSH